MKLNEINRDTRTLQSALLDLSERQLMALLDMEVERRAPRKLVLERVHQRLCILRGKRERAELFKRARVE